jgi:hypothetical protein
MVYLLTTLLHPLYEPPASGPVDDVPLIVVSASRWSRSRAMRPEERYRRLPREAR